MNKQLEGSCSEAAMALGLSPLATLALRVSLMILRRIVSVPKDRCLKVDIRSSKLTIRVSRVRVSTSSRTKKTKCAGAPVSSSTEITGEVIDQPQLAVSSSERETERLYEMQSQEALSAIL